MSQRTSSAVRYRGPRNDEPQGHNVPSDSEGDAKFQRRRKGKRTSWLRIIMIFFLVSVGIGAIDFLLLGGVTHDILACPSSSGCEEGSTPRRLGLHQGKAEAYLLYFFIAHVYDKILNPWHWTPDMRTRALSGAEGNRFDLNPSLQVVDVGAGTGFTTVGVVKAGVPAKNIHMLDQSHAQLLHASRKPELASIEPAGRMVVGDAENLPLNWTKKFDRYVSAGSIEYWPHPQDALDEAIRVLKPGGKAMIIGPARATNPISRFFSDLWYLFPEEVEYRAWFEAAGFVDVSIDHIEPEWYNHDRSHGLIMGCVVVGTRPEDWTPPARVKARFAARKAAADASGDAPKSPVVAAAESVKRGDGTPRAFFAESLAFLANVVKSVAHEPSLLFYGALAIPRFLLGAIGGTYYAFVPIYIWIRNAAVAFLQHH